MCQLEWATGFPAILSNMILGVSLRLFLDEIVYESDWGKQMALPNMSDPIQYTAGLNRTVGDCL